MKTIPQTHQPAAREHSAGSSTVFAWQGWRLSLPGRWNPIKLEGGYDEGFALIADIDQPQLGVRWRTVAGKKFDAARWAQRALRDEVGALAAGEASSASLDTECWSGGGLLFLEPQPPGRDVFVAQSRVSRRVVEIVHHVQRRDRTLADVILPGLSDSSPQQPTLWSVFDLSCVVPAGFHLTAQRLNAGDLTLTFERGREPLTVRQVALAGMALRRQPIEKWLVQQERTAERHYRPKGEIEPVSVGALAGVRRVSMRRRRFGLLRRLGQKIVTYALLDAVRDRLLLLQAGDESTLHEVARTVGGG